jgi:hypothetical protein
MVLQSLAGLPAFLVYFCTAIIAVVAYLFVYTRVTPHDEFKLIRDNDGRDRAWPQPARLRAAAGQRHHCPAPAPSRKVVREVQITTPTASAVYSTGGWHSSG